MKVVMDSPKKTNITIAITNAYPGCDKMIAKPFFQAILSVFSSCKKKQLTV